MCVLLYISGRIRSQEGYSFRFADESDRLAAPRVRRENTETNSPLRRRSAGAGGHGKAVEQYDIHTGERIQVFPSGSVAARSLGLQQTSISLCCLDRKRSIGDFGFRFVDRSKYVGGNGDEDGSSSGGSESNNFHVHRKKVQYPRPDMPISSSSSSSFRRRPSGAGGDGPSRPSNNGKAIEQYDLCTGEVIATFISGKECSRVTGYNRNSMSLYCSGQWARCKASKK